MPGLTPPRRYATAPWKGADHRLIDRTANDFYQPRPRLGRPARGRAGAVRRRLLLPGARLALDAARDGRGGAPAGPLRDALRRARDGVLRARLRPRHGPPGRLGH